jgi:glycosyltransferase involved in cell wall biosynthesis
MRSDPRQDKRLRVVVIGHAYNAPGRMGPFSELGREVDLTLVGPQIYKGLALTSPDLPENDRTLKVIALPAARFGRSQFLMRGLRKALRSSRPDVVCIEYDLWHLQFLQLILTLKSLGSAAQVVPMVKKNTYRASDSFLGRTKRLVSQWGIRRVGTIIAASEMTREMYIRELGVPNSMIVVQPHLAVDTSRFKPRVQTVGPRTLRIGFVGKLGALKGVPELLRAFSEVQQRTDIPVELWLAGGITDPDVATAISEAGNVHHVGEINNDDLHSFLSDIDVFVMPARTLPDHQEHDGRAVLEAMSSAIPCVVSDSGILPEIVSHAEGRVFPAGDIECLVNCLKELIDSPELRRDLGMQARQRAITTVSPQVLSAERTAMFKKTVEELHDRSTS